MFRHNDERDGFTERRMVKNKSRHDKWQERQERSAVSREDIQLLQMKRADLRKALDTEAAAKEARMTDGGKGDSNRNKKKTSKRDDSDDDSDANDNDNDDDVNSTASSSSGTGVAGKGGGAADKTAPVVEHHYRYFNELPISQRTLMGLERGNYKKMTPIQSDSLHLALAGCDVLGAAKTGSGKTLCFVVPALERLFMEHWDAEMGVGAILLSPTRELALQIFKVMQVVGYKHVLSAALLTGGRDVQEERKRLHAISIIVGTPGRILHHLQDDATLVLDNLQLLCMDEADRLLDMGFREAVTNILRYLPPQRQTLMFSATQTTDVQMLAQMSLHSPRYVTSQTITTSPTPSTLSQNFLIVELERKLDVLLMFLKRHPNDKVVVFLSTCNQVKYMYLAFSKILKKMRIPSMCLTSKMKQFRREEVFLTFCRCKSAVLFCTDVASRGLDFPLVHWVVQYDCPDSAQTYIHRAGRTARAGARGVSLLMLTPTEAPMLSYLANKNLILREVGVKPGLLQDSHDMFVALVIQGLKYEAQKAFIAYLRSVYFASNKHVFNVANVEVESFARSLGLLVVPDLSELQKLQRGAKNLPWDVVNFIDKRDRAAARKQLAASAKAATEETTPKKVREKKGGLETASDSDSDAGDSDTAAAPTMTRKEKHLKASDMFRVLQQKQKYAPKSVSADNGDDDEDDFFVKKPMQPKAGGDDSEEGGAEAQPSMKLTVEERIAGLSKNKRRRFIENPDLRIRDLGLNTRVIYNSDDDEEDEAEAAKAAAKRDALVQKQLEAALALRGSPNADERAGGSSGGDSDGDSDDDADKGNFADRLRRRMQDQKLTDGERAKKLRRLRKLQKMGRLTKKQTLESSGVTSAVGGPRPDRESSNEYIDDDISDDEDDDGDDNSSDGGSDAEAHADGESDGDDDGYVYRGIDDSDSSDEEPEKPPAKRRRN